MSVQQSDNTNGNKQVIFYFRYNYDEQQITFHGNCPLKIMRYIHNSITDVPLGQAQSRNFILSDHLSSAEQYAKDQPSLWHPKHFPS